MEQKGVFTLALFGVIFFSFLASTVTCRPKGTSSAKGQYQHYDTHHNHHHTPHRLSNSNSHHQHNHHSSSSSHLKHNSHSSHPVPHHVHETKSEPGSDDENRINLLHSEPSVGGVALPLPASSPVKRQSSSSPVTKMGRATTGSSSSARLSAEDYDDYDDEDDDEDGDSGGGRHAYLMTTDKKKSSAEKLTEDQALSQAFEKHMRPSSSVKLTAKEVHDVYAYQLPSDLWFVVRYSKNADGQVEKYMNIVDSFTNYLDKLDKDVKTVSVNVKGVETVFRLTTKHNNSSS